MKKMFAVIGLGKFGASFAKTLMKHNFEVLAIDRDEEKVNEIADSVTQALSLNVLDEKALRDAGIKNADAVIVSIGENIEANILAVTLLKKLGIKHIIAKAVNDLHGLVLENLGVSKIVHPERDMAERVANSIARTDILETIELSADFSIVEVQSPSALWGKKIIETHLRSEFHLTVIAVKKADAKAPGEGWQINPKPADMIHEGDVLVVLGHNRDIRKFEKFYNL